MPTLKLCPKNVQKTLLTATTAGYLALVLKQQLFSFVLTAIAFKVQRSAVFNLTWQLKFFRQPLKAGFSRQQPRPKRFPVREKSSKAAAAAFQPSDCSSDAEALSKKVKAVVRKAGAQ